MILRETIYTKTFKHPDDKQIQHKYRRFFSRLHYI